MTRLKCLVFLASCLPLGAQLAGTFRQLQRYEIPAAHAGTGEGPLAEIVPLMGVYKEQLRALTGSVLPGESDPERLRAALQRRLREAGIPVGAIDESVQRRPYGQVHRVDVTAAAGHPGLLAVTYHLQLSHALDSSLTLYRGGQAIFQADHNEYTKWELDAYEIAAPQFAANRMLLSATSGVYGNGSYVLSLQLYDLPAAGPPKLLYQKNFHQKMHQVALDPDGIRLEQYTFVGDISRGCCQSFPTRLSIQPGRLARVQPLGFDPRQFLEAWLAAPWPDAVGFSEPANRARLQARHTRGPAIGEFGTNERCDDLAKLWQVSFDHESYFLIERTGTWHFRLRDVRTEPLAACKPDDQYPWRTTMFEKPLED